MLKNNLYCWSREYLVKGLLVCLTLAGCQGPGPEASAKQWDGIYRGKMTITRLGGYYCTGREDVGYLVKDNRIRIRNAASEILVTIDALGHFHGYAGQLESTGDIVGDTLTLRELGGNCLFTTVAKKGA